MAQPWKTIESIPTVEGTLELRKRGDDDFLIVVGDQVLMNSLNNRSEIVLGELACRDLRNRFAPRVLVGGLGMGFTLRAVLDNLPPAAEVVVAELNPVVLQWCRGPLSAMTAGAADDPRVTVEITDVADLVAKRSPDRPFDAIVFDLYRGPHHHTDKLDDPLYGSRAIERVRRVLAEGGIFAVWGEDPDAGFIKRLQSAGFAVSCERPGRGGYRHAVFIAQKENSRSSTARRGRRR